MKQVFILAISLLAFFTTNAQLLWYEDFFDENDGAQTGVAAGTPGGTWSTTAASVRREDMPIADEILLAENTSTEQRWETNEFDISSAGYAIISADVWSALVDSDDYLRLYYKVDGGSEILFYELAGGNGLVDLAPATPASAIVSGNTLQIVARFRNNTRTIFIFTFNSIYGLDNVTVTPADILYSRKSGTWTDVTGGFGGTGTWSTDRSGTPACGCVPLNDVVAVIQNGHTVTIPTSQTAVGNSGTPNLAPGAVDVESGGILQYNVSGVTLGIQQGLLRIRGGGTINSSGAGITGEQVSFDADVGGAVLQVDAAGTMAIEDLILGTSATNLHYLTGSGTLTITDDIIINASGGTLTNNRSASFTVGDDLNFTATGSSFVNNGIVTLTGDIYATANSDDDNIVTNSSGATLGIGGIDPTEADIDILNYGTINQSGNFSNISTADTNFDNLTNAVWNWSLTPNTTYDTDVATVLNLTASGNTFNYSGAGAQRIIPTTYYHITLSNSGAKDANSASFSVGGNWTHSGTATFTTAGGTITFNGTAAQTITPATGGISFRGLTFNNSFGASPQITLNGNVTAVTTLTMSDGNINLNGNTFTIGASAASPGTLSHAGASGNGWMYGGNLIRYMATAATTIGSGDQNEGFFPLGSAADFRPFYIGKSNTGSSGGAITVSHTNSTSTSDVSIADTNPVATITRRHDSFWTVSTSGITAGTWALRAGGTNFGTIQETADLRMSTSTGVVGTNSAATGSVSDPRVNRTGLTFGQLTNNFHLASTDATNSPLPIELISFTAQLINNEVEINWSTASETNNDYFTIERANNLEHFKSIHKEKGKGTTKEKNNYKTLDRAPLSGRSYYRLKQTDFDGKFSYSEVRVIDYEGPQFATLTAFPTPTQGQNLTIEISGLRNSTHIPVQILNIQGQIVYDKVIEVTTPGLISEEIPAGTFPAGGLYIIKAGETIHLTKKIVVE